MKLWESITPRDQLDDGRVEELWNRTESLRIYVDTLPGNADAIHKRVTELSRLTCTADLICMRGEYRGIGSTWRADYTLEWWEKTLRAAEKKWRGL